MKNLDGSFKNILLLVSLRCQLVYSYEYRTTGLILSYLHCLVFKEHLAVCFASSQGRILVYHVCYFVSTIFSFCRCRCWQLIYNNISVCFMSITFFCLATILLMICAQHYNLLLLISSPVTLVRKMNSILY